MKLENCKLCGSVPIIYDHRGIGDIVCQNCGIKGCLTYDEYGCKYSICHFSGKFRTTKKQAIINWNKINNEVGE